MSSSVNGAAELPWPAFVFGALFAMHSHLFGEVMDIGPDRSSGRRTTATEIGAVPSKLLIAAILCVESALVWWYFRDLEIAVFLLAGALWFLADAAWLWRDSAYSPQAMKLFMWAWNGAALLGILWDYRSASLTGVRPVAGL